MVHVQYRFASQIDGNKFCVYILEFSCLGENLALETRFEIEIRDERNCDVALICQNPRRKPRTLHQNEIPKKSYETSHVPT